jgi:predicted DsbA family dithiol-disulfide isomerase
MVGGFVDIEAVKKNSVKMAKDRGLPCCEMETIYNSKPAQELSVWAGSKNKDMDFRKAVFSACYGEGRNISDLAVLKAIAASLQLDPAEAETVLEKSMYTDVVDNDWSRKQELELVAAPTYFINNNRLVGCHPYEKMKDFLVKNGAQKRNQYII